MLRRDVSDARNAPDPDRLTVPADEGFAPRLSVDVERSVDAPIDEGWSVLCDYEHARPPMLTEHFADYAVQQQEGERTVIDYRLRVGRHQGASWRPSRSRWRAGSCASVTCIRRW